MSAIVIAGYGGVSILDPNAASYLGFTALPYGRTYNTQAGIQVAGTICSLVMGIFFGILASFVIRYFYSYENQENLFYEDETYFELPDFDNKLGRNNQIYPVDGSKLINQESSFDNFNEDSSGIKFSPHKNKKNILPPINSHLKLEQDSPEKPKRSEN